MDNFVAYKKMDNLGRIVIPKDMRRFFDIKPNQCVKMIPTDGGILIVPTKTELIKE